MPGQNKTLLYSVYSVYFICGLAQCFEGLFLPEFKTRFHLSYTEQMYIIFAKNMPFVLFSIAIGYAARKFGFRNCLAVALLLFAAGTFLLVPGLRSGSFGTILAAFFIIGVAFNMELVAGNPLLSMLGPPATASSRLNTGNALGAVAQIIAPLCVVAIIPGSILSIEEKMPYIENLFVITALVLTGMAVYIFTRKQFLNIAPISNADTVKKKEIQEASIWSRPKVMLGLMAIFLVLGFESCLFGFYRNFVEDKSIAGLSAHQSQKLFTVYFAVFALGRIAGSYIQTRITPALTLAFSLSMAMLLLFVVLLSSGVLAVAAMTAIGFFASIFFPTLFSIAIEGLSEEAGKASGLLAMGFLGGAILPVMQGRIADLSGLKTSFVIGFVPYLFALFYLWKVTAGRPDQPLRHEEIGIV